MTAQVSFQTAGRFVPPMPELAPDVMGPFELARRMRTNGIAVYGRRAYEEEVIERRLLGRRSFVLNAPEMIRHVLVDQTEAFERTPASLRILRPLVGEGLLLSEGSVWRHQRRTLAPSFTPRSVGLLVPHMLSAVREIVRDLESSAGAPIDLFAVVQRLALEIAGRTMFSLEMGKEGVELRGFLERYARSLARPRLLDLILPSAWPSPYDWPRRWFRRPWAAFLDRLIAARLRQVDRPEAPRDLLDLLLAARDPDTGQAFTPEQVRDQVATMILAGHETTAVMLFWALALLALVPEVQEKVAAETAALDCNALPDLAKLAYTRAVLDETLRLYPPAYVIVRAAREASEVAGLRFRRGDLIVISPWVLHRHRRHWADPEAFIPERFLPSALPVERMAYLPFGAGPRVCIGASFALTEATLALALLIGTFRIRLTELRPVLPVGIITTQPDHHPAFELTMRKP